MMTRETEEQKKISEMQPIFDALKCTFHIDCECGQPFVYEGIPDSYSNEANATRDAYDFGWREVNGKVCCPKCAETKEENEND